MQTIQIICTIIVAFALVVAVAFGLGWMHAGYKAERLTELSGQPVSQSDVFWCGDSLTVRIDKD